MVNILNGFLEHDTRLAHALIVYPSLVDTHRLVPKRIVPSYGDANPVPGCEGLGLVEPPLEDLPQHTDHILLVLDTDENGLLDILLPDEGYGVAFFFSLYVHFKKSEGKRVGCERGPRQRHLMSSNMFLVPRRTTNEAFTAQR